jgi:hypothetical protein
MNFLKIACKVQAQNALKMMILLAIILTSTSLSGQTREQQRRADAYDQNNRNRNQNATNDTFWWDLLVSAASKPRSSTGIVSEKYNNGNWYAGQYANRQFQGVGTYFDTKNNRYFTGEWEKGTTKGFGISYSGDDFNKQERYLGVFDASGFRQGYGLFFSRNGQISLGTWKDGKKNGFSITYFKTSRSETKEFIKYFGEYKKDNINGYGIKYYSDGSFESGLWENYKLVKPLTKLEVLEKLGF